MTEDTILRIGGAVLTAAVALIGFVLPHVRERDKLRTLERLTSLVEATPGDAAYFSDLQGRRDDLAKAWLHAGSRAGILERRLRRLTMAVVALLVLSLISYLLPGVWGSVIRDGIVLATAVALWSFVPIAPEVFRMVPLRNQKRPSQQNKTPETSPEKPEE